MNRHAPITPSTFEAQVATGTAMIGGRPLDQQPTARQGGGIRDGRPAGWRLCLPAGAHRPTVNQGRARVLRLLPEGPIQFAR